MCLNIFQRVFKFAMLADAANGEVGTRGELEQHLQRQVTDQIKGTEWQLKWGPAIWKLKPNEKTYPANAWYIVYHPNAQFEDGSVHPTYVIAIAGTPMRSLHDIHKEDDTVEIVVDFNAWASPTGVQSEPVDVTSQQVTSNTPYISKGTAWGTFHLVHTKSSEDVVSPGKTILEYFSTLDPPLSTRFIITGHSLGGALTTTLAPTLVSIGALPSGNTLTYPMAGFSAGNAEWASLFTKFFPPSEPPSYKGWNRNLVNNLDIFPQLWCTIKADSPGQWIGRIATIYGTKTPAEAKKQAEEYFHMPRGSGVVYHPVPSFYFDGTAPLSTPENFEIEALDQHYYGYFPAVGLPKPPKPPHKKPDSFEHPVVGVL